MFDMHIPDVEVFKEIPGYKVILKAVLKCQIQALVEQLSKQTGEESVLVTACPDDGTLTHLGSEVGKDFLGAHDEFKSKFLGFCFKRQQVQQKPQVPISENVAVRRKGASARGKRPRLAPYSTTRPMNVERTADTNDQEAKFPQSQNMFEDLQFYQKDIKQEETDDDMHQKSTGDSSIGVVKTEPGVIGDQMALPFDTDHDDGNEIALQETVTLFHNASADGIQDRDLENTQDLSGIQSILKAENQSDIERGEGQGHLETDFDIGTNVGQGQDNIKAEIDSDIPDHSIIVIENETLVPKNINLKERRNRNISKALSRALKSDQLKTDKDFGKYLLLSEDEIRPFSCHLCPKKFKERHHLKYHLRIHSGLRPYKCEVCAKTFTQSSSLNTHKKLHLNEVRCMYCDIHFRKQSDFERHECKGSSV